MNDTPFSAPPEPSGLRQRAQRLIQLQGPGLGGAKDASVALRVLFDLASSPDTAHDALALLHELQVHQVELDLQYEELLSSRAELESAWARQMQWRESSPCAQMVLDPAGRLLECNARALKCLDQTLQTVRNKTFTNWLAMADVERVQAWLEHAQHSEEAVSIHFVLRAPGRADRPVVAAACLNPMAPGMLLSWVDAEPATKTP
jgi:PAS domain-containing protein